MKYLKITLHDNDFIGNWEALGDCLLKCFRNQKYPDIEDLDKLKNYIAYLWWSISNIDSYLRWKGTRIEFTEDKIDLFKDSLSISIIMHSDIEEWDNYESIFVPLDDFNDVIILR